MNHSIKIKTLSERQGLYKLSEPVSYGWGGSKGTTSHVVASKSNSWGSTGASSWLGGYPTECLVFPATAEGAIIEMLEIGGSYQCPGGHAQALEEMGFPLLTEEREPTEAELLGRLSALEAELEALTE